MPPHRHYHAIWVNPGDAGGRGERQKALLLQGFIGNDLVQLRDSDGVDRDEAALLTAVLKADHAVDLGEQGVVLAAADVEAGLQRGSALANQDGAAGDGLAAEALDAEALRIGVATVFGRT